VFGLSRLGARIRAPITFPFENAGHGYDAFGFDPRALALGVGLSRPIYDHYFRVKSHGAGYIPARGPCILAANHSGLLPIDAAMIMVDVIRHAYVPRAPRPIGDLFIPFLPWVGTAMARMGMVSGTRANFRHLLENDELVLVFPEGTEGIGKGFSKRYQLQAWRVGHAELAIRHRAPIVPVAVIGAEEAWPQLGRIDRFHWFGAPFLPVPVTPIPLPVRLDIHYGEPIFLDRTWSPDQADDPAAVRDAAARVRAAVEQLISAGRRARQGS
jgi:1-acyl-sn-glycerol-3-phosphate acyltransferase